MEEFGIVNLVQNEPNLEAPLQCQPWYRKLFILLIPYKVQVTGILLAIWISMCYFNMLPSMLCLGLRRNFAYPPLERTEIDFASSYCGAKIVSVDKLTPCSFTCNYLFKMIPFSCRRNDPNYILSPGVNFDKNFCFEGHSGVFTIELCEAIKMKGFTLRHLPPEDNHFCKASLAKFKSNFGSLIPDAPKNFVLYGSSTNTEKSSWTYLGDFTFKDNGFMRQHFVINKKNENTKYLRFIVKSNQGDYWETKVHKVYVQGEKQNPNGHSC